MHTAKLLTGILIAAMLLAVASCQAEPETTTVITTKTAQAPTTTLTTTVAAPAVTQTQTVVQTTTVTQTVTTSPAATTTTSEPTTTTTTGGFEPVTSADGKLQIVYAEYQHPATSSSQVVGKVENISNEVLSARITAEFLNDSGGVAQTKWVTVKDLAPGEQKTFTIMADLFVGAFSGFNIYVEVWE